MGKQQSLPVKIFLAVTALLGWFALTAQFYININSGLAPLPELVTRYFSYFTILTNLIVAVCSTILLLAPGSKWGQFFSKPQTLTAITVYILIVGLIYNVILRFLWKPEGLQMIVDELLHSIIPVLFLLFWLLFVVKDKLQWKNVWPWLIYPLVYIICVLIRGSLSGFYPYPFIDMTQLGLSKVLINSAGIAVLFILMSFLFVGIGRFITKKK